MPPVKTPATAPLPPLLLEDPINQPMFKSRRAPDMVRDPAFTFVAPKRTEGLSQLDLEEPDRRETAPRSPSPSEMRAALLRNIREEMEPEPEPDGFGM